MQLIHGDCLEKMKDIPDKSIDMILCDLPYGTTACRWDVVIPFGPLWEQYKRIIKDRGAIVLFGNNPFTSIMIVSNLDAFKYTYAWDKLNRHTGYGNASFMPLKRHEDICVFCFNGKPTFNKQMGKGDPYTAKRSGKKPGVYENGGLYPKDGINTGERNPISVLFFKADNKKEMGMHPTQKPVALLEYLIKTYTLEGETVLDNTMGSGSTGIACINTNRNFVGIEKDDKYFEIAKKRIEGHLTTAST